LFSSFLAVDETGQQSLLSECKIINVTYGYVIIAKPLRYWSTQITRSGDMLGDIDATRGYGRDEY